MGEANHVVTIPRLARRDEQYSVPHGPEAFAIAPLSADFANWGESVDFTKRSSRIIQAGCSGCPITLSNPNSSADLRDCGGEVP